MNRKNSIYRLITFLVALNCALSLTAQNTGGPADKEGTSASETVKKAAANKKEATASGDRAKTSDKKDAMPAGDRAKKESAPVKNNNSKQNEKTGSAANRDAAKKMNGKPAPTDTNTTMKKGPVPEKVTEPVKKTMTGNTPAKKGAAMKTAPTPGKKKLVKTGPAVNKKAGTKTADMKTTKKQKDTGKTAVKSKKEKTKKTAPAVKKKKTTKKAVKPVKKGGKKVSGTAGKKKRVVKKKGKRKKRQGTVKGRKGKKPARKTYKKKTAVKNIKSPSKKVTKGPQGSKEPVKKQAAKYPKIVPGKAVTIEPIVINFGSRASLKYLEHWQEYAGSRDVYEISRVNGLMMVGDQGPVRNRKAAFVHKYGSTVHISGLKRGVRYYLFIDFIKFRNITKERFPSPLHITFREKGGGRSSTVVVTVSDLGTEQPWRVEIPYELTIEGSVDIFFREEAPGSGIWGIWDLVIYNQSKIPATIRGVEMQPERLKPTERVLN